MNEEKRTLQRFQDFGRVNCSELCAVSGVLEDISLRGCRVHFDAIIAFDCENDYELNVRLSRDNLEPLELLCHPQWCKCVNGMTDIGFEILRSKDSSRLENYIKLISESNSGDIPDTGNSQCQFI
ncbi:MAG: PilZ domain-containing protein [Treponema sp.]|nr:PilZ domain-containing protein [Treponema sp.]